MYFTCLHLQKLVPSNTFDKRFQHHVPSTKDFYQIRLSLTTCITTN